MTIHTEQNGNRSEAEGDQRDLMDLVNGNGPWQWLIFAMIFVSTIPDGSNNMSMTFFAPKLDHWCARPPNSNISVEEWKRIALPPENPQCFRYKFINISHYSEKQFQNISSSNETVPCDSWEFDNSFYTSTIVSQWNLVCDKEWLISMSKSIFVVGYIISSSVFAYLADRLGRKLVTMMCNVLAVVSGICTLFSNSFLMFAISRVFVAAGVTGAANAAGILLVEIVSPQYRSPYYTGYSVSWLVGALHLPLIAWLIRDWFWMEMVIIAPNVLFLFCWWWIPESPRWLAHGNPKEAVKVLSNAAEKNGVQIPSAKLEEMVSNISKWHGNETPKVNVMRLFHPDIRKRTLILWFIWSATAFVYYGILYNTNELVGDPFINYTIYNIAELFACLLSQFIIEYKGRRWPLAISLAGAGAACFLNCPLPEDPWVIRASVALFGMFCIAATFYIVNLFTFEIFPTLLRNIGTGSASTVARFAAILAPFVRELERATHPVVPQILFGIVSIVSAGLALLLPETLNCSVPDTMTASANL